MDETKCWYCERSARAGLLTCGGPNCDEKMARAENHSSRRGLAVRGGRPRPRSEADDPPSEALVLGVCGNTNGHVPVSCGRPPRHEGMHVSGRLGWQTGGRPYQLDDDSLSRLGPVQPQADAERLAELLQVLLTARAQMLGLGEGLKKALSEMPRAVDQHAVRGLIGALGRIVGHLDSFKIAPGETSLNEKSRLGADRLTAGEFDRKTVSSASVTAQISVQPQRSRLIAAMDAVHGPSLSEVASEMSSCYLIVVEHFRQRIAELEGRLGRAEEARENDGAWPLAVQYAADRARLGRELTRREEALLVSAVRGLWGGPAFGGDWVDRELESVAPEAVKRGYDALERLGYLIGERVAFRGVRAAVVAMDRENLVEAELDLG